MKWNVSLYVTPGGQPVVSHFIEGLDVISYAKTVRQIGLLETYGPDIGMPHTKPLGDGLIELRVRGKREIRIFYVYAKGKQIYLIYGFVKKTQQTPKKHLNIAYKRKEEIENI